MLRAINNFLYRSKDLTRNWRADDDRIQVDLRLCSLCGIKVGGIVETGGGMEALGPSQDCKKAARGYVEWYSKGVTALLDEMRLSDFTLDIRPWGEHKTFAGRLLLENQVVRLSQETQVEELVDLLGEPFGRSESDGLTLFYEYEQGEVQYFFSDEETLESVEFAYEAELGVKKAREYYGIDRDLPPEMARRVLA